MRKRYTELKSVLEDPVKAKSIPSLDAVDDRQFTPLMQAAEMNWAKGVELLLDSTRDKSCGQVPAATIDYADPVNHRTALMIACRAGALHKVYTSTSKTTCLINKKIPNNFY